MILFFARVAPKTSVGFHVHSRASRLQPRGQRSAVNSFARNGDNGPSGVRVYESCVVFDLINRST